MTMTAKQHWATLAEQGEALSVAARSGSLSAEAPTCPGWTVADVVRHTGVIHRWVTDVVKAARQERPDKPSAPATEMADEQVMGWFDAGLTYLLTALRSAPADLACFTFLPAPTPLQMWSRRMAHETTIHRADVEFAHGRVPDLPGALAADGLDELLRANLQQPGRGPTSAAPYTIGFAATDPDQAWTGRLDRDGFTLIADVDQPDVLVRGRASALYLFVWNRLDQNHPDIEVAGDPQLLTHWRAAAAI